MRYGYVYILIREICEQYIRECVKYVKYAYVSSIQQNAPGRFVLENEIVLRFLQKIFEKNFEEDARPKAKAKALAIVTRKNPTDFE